MAFSVAAPTARTAGAIRVEHAAPWVTGLVLAAPVLVAYYPPMTDIAFHEGAIGLLRHLHDPAYVPDGLYVRNLGEPNQLFHMAGWALSYVVSTRWAVKLLVAAAVAALPVCAARMARHVGASPLAALIVAPMGLGWLFSWGLIANLIGLCSLLAMLPVLDRLAEVPSVRLAVLTVGADVLLYFSHEAMLFVFGGIALGLTILRPWSWRGSALRLVPLAAAVGITLGQARWQLRYMTPTVNAVPMYWRSLGSKLKEVLYIVLPASDLPVELAMFALTAMAVFAFLWLRTVERRAERAERALPRPDEDRLLRLRRWAIDHRWEVVAALGFAAYFTFPVTMNGATLVHQRWFPPAFAILAVVSAPRDVWTRSARIPRAAVFVIPIASLFASWPAFADSNRQYRALEPLIDRIQPASAVAALDLGPGNPTRTYSVNPADGRVLATRGGRLVYAFTDSPISPVVLRRRYQWTESLVRIAFNSWRFIPEHDLKRFRYLLVRTQDSGLAWLATYALSEDARFLTQSGEWLLFESKHTVVPLMSPDAPVEQPQPPTLRQKMVAMLDAAQKNAGAPMVEVPPEGPQDRDQPPSP